ncbi:MAG: prolipoprotein diacylglyceryl transferase [Oscillospiraceae bacterium]|nr:prolipoprotein diacylglyceryl transferase [Oscillospiraceae bacterium]
MQTMLREASISFPMFGNFSINPPASFQLFGHTFYWYGAIIALGFILGILYCSRRSKAFAGISSDDLFDYVLWLIPTAIIGARLYYVLFNLPDYLARPADIFKVWEGGLAIYGGIIAGVLLALVWSRKKRIPVGALGDIAMYGLLIGQCIGRWGNFINREAFGRETTVFCRMGLTVPGKAPIYVHPTFLYESLWNFAGFLFLHFYYQKHERKFDGEVTLLYVAWYGLGRAMIEGLRTDSLYIPGTMIRVSQLLAALSAVVAVVLLVVLLRRRQQPELYVRRAALAEAGEPAPEAVVRPDTDGSADSGSDSTHPTQ